MPIDSILVLAGAVAISMVFTGVLIRGDHQMRAVRSSLAASGQRRRSF